MMNSYVTAIRYPVLTIGCIAADILKEPVDGHIEAVFDSTFYIRSDDRLMCLGRIDMEAGPINCITAASKSVNWRAVGLKRQTKIRISSTLIAIGGMFQFPLSQVHRWTAEPLNLTNLNWNVAKGLEVFHAAVAGRDDIDGLGRFLISGYRPDPHNYVCRAAEMPLTDARKWLLAIFQEPGRKHDPELNWVRKLSGLGPGLTPSGDDLLGGIMIALYSLGKGNLSQILWPFVERYAKENGNSISLAHISAAAKGTGSVVIHRIIAAILTGDTVGIHAAIKDVAAIGHSSGWDIMTGVIITLEAWHTNPSKN